MSVWSKIAKIAGLAGGVAALPFTGGASLLPYLAATGTVSGALAQARGEGRQTENAQRAAQQQQALQAAQFNRQAPSARANSAVRGDILAGAQPVTTIGSGRDLRFSGGLSPALLSGNTRQLGQNMSRQALMSQLGQGGANDPYTFNTQPFQPQQAGLLDKILGGVGLAGEIASLLPAAQKKTPQQVIPSPQTNALFGKVRF